jgi:hypothetical protein
LQSEESATETAGLIYLAWCMLIFFATGKPLRVRPLGWRLELASLGACMFLSLIALPLAILLSLEWLIGVRVLQVRQGP